MNGDWHTHMLQNLQAIKKSLQNTQCLSKATIDKPEEQV